MVARVPSIHADRRHPEGQGEAVQAHAQFIV
jgi:hypothetical protein